MRRAGGFKLILAILAIFCGVGLATIWGAGQRDRAPSELIAMDFEPKLELTGSDGKKISNLDWLGRHVLVYFGFTYCPDVCPTDLQRLSDALAALPPGARQNWVVAFVTVDPERDTPKIMQSYLKNFDASIIGLSGSVDAVAKIQKNYRVFAAKQPLAEKGDYTINHTALFYILDPAGRPLGVIRPQIAPVRLAQVMTDLSQASK
jgi:cytochrome oxidase Cu insertion factor (SCO1/SenC/PrrC family)